MSAFLRPSNDALTCLPRGYTAAAGGAFSTVCLLLPLEEASAQPVLFLLLLRLCLTSAFVGFSLCPSVLFLSLVQGELLFSCTLPLQPRLPPPPSLPGPG